MRRGSVLGTATAALCALVAAFPVAGAGAEELRPVGATGQLGDELLSDEFKVTRVATIRNTSWIFSQPSTSSRKVARLRLQTEDGEPEIYLVLRSKLDPDGVRTWLQIRVPKRPNGVTGWVLDEDMGDLRTVRTHLRISRKALKATLYRNGKVIWTSRVGIGAPSTPTPAGRFWIRERLKGLGDGSAYGPWAFGTSAYSTKLTDWPGGGVVGIHGTNQPKLIPGRPSHGCVRVPNNKIRRLARLMPVGTPVQIV